jgi:hypothetical protein
MPLGQAEHDFIMSGVAGEPAAGLKDRGATKYLEPFASD